MAFGNNTRSSRPLAGSSVCAYSCVSVCASSWKAIATGQRIKSNVASLGATALETDASAHPKQQPRQARRTTSRGQWRGVRPLPMTPTPHAKVETSAPTRPQVRPPRTSLERSNPKPVPWPACLLCVRACVAPPPVNTLTEDPDTQQPPIVEHSTTYGNALPGVCFLKCKQCNGSAVCRKHSRPG